MLKPICFRIRLDKERPRSVCVEFSWSHLLVLDDKNVTFLLLSRGRFLRGNFISAFKKKKVDLSVFLVFGVFNSKYSICP